MMVEPLGEMKPLSDWKAGTLVHVLGANVLGVVIKRPQSSADDIGHAIVFEKNGNAQIDILPAWRVFAAGTGAVEIHAPGWRFVVDRKSGEFPASTVGETHGALLLHNKNWLMSLRDVEKWRALDLSDWRFVERPKATDMAAFGVWKLVTSKVDENVVDVLASFGGN